MNSHIWELYLFLLLSVLIKEGELINLFHAGTFADDCCSSSGGEHCAYRAATHQFTKMRYEIHGVSTAQRYLRIAIRIERRDAIRKGGRNA